jgi:probable F420-dependent oxidoreductase
VQRDPIVTAKEVATLDNLSGGRVLFGVGAGWNVEEMRNHGTDPRRRFSIMRERVEAMKAIWTQDEAEYHGEHVNFDPIWCWPKPRQKPHPPVIVGGTGAKVLDRVLAYGDEWMPNRVEDPESLGERIAELERRAEEAGRERIPVSVFGAKPDPRFVERLVAVGVDRCCFYIRPVEPAEVERQLDELAELREVATRRTA